MRAFPGKSALFIAAALSLGLAPALPAAEFNPFAMADYDDGNLQILSTGMHPAGTGKSYTVVKGDQLDQSIFDNLLPTLGKRLAQEGFKSVPAHPDVFVVVFAGVDDLRRGDGANALIGAKPIPRLVDNGAISTLPTTTTLPPGVTFSLPSPQPAAGQFDRQPAIALWANYRTWVVAIALDAAATKAAGKPVELWSLRLARYTPYDDRTINAGYLASGFPQLLRPTQAWEARSVRRNPVVRMGETEFLGPVSP